MVRARPVQRCDWRQARGCGRGGLPAVLRRGYTPAACRDVESGPRGGPLPLRLRRHEGTVLVSLAVAILAGGLATRLRPLTEQVPKILLDVAGRPFAEHQVELLRHHGISKVVFCLGYLGEQVVHALGDGERWQMTFRYLFDGSRLLGTGGALRRALPDLGGAFFVMYGDSYLDCDFKAIEASFRASGKSGLMTVLQNDDRWDRSNVELDRGRIIRYDKGLEETKMHHI